jgi:4a-hydroxytetrahydrobiopterin dehydratase
MTELLTDDQIQAELAHLPGWRQAGAALERTAELPSFPEAIQAVTRIAEVAENDDHHPDIDIRWRTLTFRCSTHSEGGVTAKDVQLAGEIDRVIEALTG